MKNKVVNAPIKFEKIVMVMINYEIIETVIFSRVKISCFGAKAHLGISLVFM